MGRSYLCISASLATVATTVGWSGPGAFSQVASACFIELDGIGRTHLSPISQSEPTERGRDIWMVVAQRLLQGADGALIKGFGVGVALQAHADRRQVFEHFADPDIVGATCLFQDGQGAAVERLGLGVAVLRGMDHRDAQQCLAHMLMLWAELLLSAGQRPLGNRQGLAMLALADKVDRLTVERHDLGPRAERHRDGSLRAGADQAQRKERSRISAFQRCCQRLSVLHFDPVERRDHIARLDARRCSGRILRRANDLGTAGHLPAELPGLLLREVPQLGSKPALRRSLRPCRAGSQQDGQQEKQGTRIWIRVSSLVEHCGEPGQFALPGRHHPVCPLLVVHGIEGQNRFPDRPQGRGLAWLALRSTGT